MTETLEILLGPLMLPVTVALLGGAVAYLVSRVWPALCAFVALISAAIVLAVGLIPLIGQPVALSRTWISLGANFTLSLDLAVTPLGMIVAIGSAVFAILITIYSFRAMSGEYWEGKFYAFLLWALAGACLVALASNLLVLLIGWEIVTVTLFLMINQGRRDARGAAAKTYGILGFADGCLLLAIALLATIDGGSANWSLTRGPMNVAEMGPIGYFIYLLIMAAALAKAGAIPLHTWIPSAAKDTPTPVMAFLPAATDKLLGIYLLAVLSLRMFTPSWPMQLVMMTIGAVTILAAVLMAMMQHNLKKLLAFHAVSQVGYMILGIGTGTTIGVIGGLFHMINNAIYKSNLFLMSGTVGAATGSDEIEDMGGLARYLPVTFVSSLIAAAAISGVPPFNGFVSKWLIYQGALQLGRSTALSGLAIMLVVVAVFGSALTLASFVKVMYSAFLSPAPKGAFAGRGRPRENFFLAAPMVVLAAACVFLGLYPHSIINGALMPAVANAATTGDNIYASVSGVDTGMLGLWNPSTATGLILIGVLLALVFLWVSTRGAKVRVVRPFLCGEVPGPDDDRFRVPGTHFYQTMNQMPSIGPLLAQGEQGAMDPYHWVARYGSGLIGWLRGLHNGLISLYVAWGLTGLAAILIYLLVAGR